MHLTPYIGTLAQNLIYVCSNTQDNSNIINRILGLTLYYQLYALHELSYIPRD